VAQFGAQLGSAVQVPHAGRGSDPGQQLQRFGLVQDVQADHGGRVGPGPGEPAGDQEAPGGRPREQARDVGGVIDVVEDKQPAVMGGQPLHGLLG